MRIEVGVVVVIFIVCLIYTAFAEDTPSKDTTETVSHPIEITGSISNQYQGRFHGSESDNDLAQYIYLNGDGFLNGKVSFALALRFYENLDNYDTYNRSSSYYSYEGISDTYSRRIRGQIYYGYVDIKDVLGPTRLRLGRQYLYQINFVHFDGASLQWQDLGDFDIELFGGRPVSYYSSVEGKYTYGGSLDWHPWRYGSFGVAYMNYSQDSESDDYIGLNAKQYLGQNLQLFENYTFLNSDSRDLQLQGVYNVPIWGLTVNATYYQQLETLHDFSDQFSPYYEAIGDYYPFYMFSLAAYKELGEHLTLNAGMTYRALTNSSNESQFNRQYQLYFGGVTFRNIMVKDLDFSVTLQHWETDSYVTSSTAELNANPNDTTNTLPDEIEVFYTVPGDRTDTINTELAYRWDKHNRIQIGTDYQKYKYNYDTNQEEQDVRTFYLKWRWAFQEHWQIYTKFSMEKQSSDPNEYYKLASSLTYSF